jgi:hypothetical protein
MDDPLSPRNEIPSAEERFGLIHRVIVQIVVGIAVAVATFFLIQSLAGV